MVKSMTGYGRFESVDEKRRLVAEIKSVNHRYLDLSIKMPRKFNPLEGRIRSLLGEHIERGKVDLYITCEDFASAAQSLYCNGELAAQYLAYMRDMSKSLKVEDDIRLSTIARMPDVFSMKDDETDEEGIWNGLETVLRRALEQFNESRAREGENLSADMTRKLDGMLSYVDVIEEKSPQIIADYRDRLTEKVKEVLADKKLDEARIATEVTIYADRICVDEETVRLKSHIQAARDALTEGGAVGRQLDFLAQEMNREANTILSKTDDAQLSNIGISLKTDIEKIREQVQNIE
ncbi:MAG: YicC family protein [Clostridiales bacterium]|nr:YicC family protein [Clostridiales bacterium]